MIQKTYKIKQNGVDIFSITVKVPDDKANQLSDYQWDSKTGLVTALDASTNERVPIEYTGNALGTIEPGPYETDNILQMEHYYWYY